MASQTSFAVLKTKILSSLALPSSLYTDLSPKGSVDAGIRDLIANINAIEGLVTTSSCAGRISVYVEGRRKNKNQIDSPVQKQEEVVNADARVDGEEEDVQFDGEVEPVSTATSSTRASAGGKGGGGYWAFVSHDPVTIRPDGSYSGGDDAAPEDAKQSLHELFGFPVEAASDAAREAPSYQSGEPPRLVKIRFEPLILHVLTQSLQHASSLLGAAQAAGFRESGLQSPKALLQDSSSASAAHPIIAIRTNGLALESVIGYVDEQEKDDGPIFLRSLVSESYLHLLLQLANSRFTENTSRISRLENALQDAFSSEPRARGGKGSEEWEDPELRRIRKREEGLKKREAERIEKAEERIAEREAEMDIDIDMAGSTMVNENPGTDLEYVDH